MKIIKPSFDYLTFDESEKLVSCIEPEFKAMVITALKTGCRHGELLELCWKEDIDFDKRIISVNRAMYKGIRGETKTGLTRKVSMSKNLFETLQAHKKLSRGKFVFSNQQYTAAQCRCPLNRAYKRAGLRHVHWHMFRHTFASHMVERGVSLVVIQQLLGHTNINTTMRYAHVNQTAKDNAVQLLDFTAQ